MTRFFVFALVLGCNQNVITGESGKSDLDDTGIDSANTDTDTEPVYVTDFSVWNASRNFYVDAWGYECDETVEDVGEVVDEGTSTWEVLHEICGVCDYFYEVEPSQESVCSGYISLGSTWRGVVLGESDAAVYFIRESDGGAEVFGEDESATFDGQQIEYSYTDELVWSVDMVVSGTQVYPLMLKEAE